jgi:hypothetical protein
MADIQFSVPKCRHWESIFLALEQLIKGVGGYPYWAYLLVFTDCGSYFSTKELRMKWEIGFFPILFQIEVRFVIIWIIVGWTKQSCWVIPIPVPIKSERNVVSILNASIELHWSICTVLFYLLIMIFWELGELIVFGRLEKTTRCWWFLKTSIIGRNSYTAFANYFEK